MLLRFVGQCLEAVETLGSDGSSRWLTIMPQGFVLATRVWVVSAGVDETAAGDCVDEDGKDKADEKDDEVVVVVEQEEAAAAPYELEARALEHKVASVPDAAESAFFSHRLLQTPISVRQHVAHRSRHLQTCPLVVRRPPTEGTLRGG